MPELPPTNPASKPTEPDEPERTGLHHSATPHISASDDLATGTVIAGKYKLLEAIGEGGMGAVWMAQQIEPVKRHVAVKLIRAGMDSKSVVARFEAERQALSMMDHPNIARVFDVGTTANGRPFFVMELVKGTPITDFCDQRKLTPRQRLELFVPVCLAIQHAHQKGIIHRDIKPSNVLVALHDDKPVPKVIDFGVAKATGFTLTEKTLHTGFEQVVGTPAYMSPEQATFNQLDIDTRSDVYSLGVLLYELLTGTTPIERQRFKQAALLEMLRVVREEEPPRPSTRLSSTETKASIAEKRGTEPARLGKELRTELDWVVMKSLEKDRVRRYATAVNFAEDVQRYLGGEAVQAHPPSMSYRIGKVVRRNRGPVVAAAAILLGLIGGAIGTVYGMIRADGERTANSLREQAETERDGANIARTEALKARREEESARGIAERALEGEKSALAGEKKAKAQVALLSYAHAVDLAFHEFELNHIARARELLDNCPPELRGWEWRFVHRLCHGELAILKGHANRVNSASFSADGQRIVTVSTDDTVRIWNAETGKEIALIRDTAEPFVPAFGPKVTQMKASFSNDGRRVVTAHQDNTARVWDAETGRQITLFKGHTNWVNSASFSPDDRRVVSSSNLDGTVRVWDSNSGAELVFFKVIAVDSACFSSDGRRIVSASGDGTARVWDAEKGSEIALLRGHTLALKSALFSSDGRRVVTASEDRTARVWDARTGKELTRLERHTSEVITASFSRDGRRIVTASWDKTAGIWDAETGKELATLKGQINSASFSVDGRRVVTASANGVAQLWETETGLQLATLVGHSDVGVSAAFSPDGRRVVTASWDGTARVWDAEPDQKSFLLSGQTRTAWRHEISLSSDGRQLVASTPSEDTARVWDAETGMVLAFLKGHSGGVTTASFSPNDRRIVTTSYDRTARVWDARTGKELVLLKGDKGAWEFAMFSPDGRRIITVSRDDTACVWDAETGNEIARLDGRLVESALFSPDGRRVLTASTDGSVRVWSAETGKGITRLDGHTSKLSLTQFSLDGRSILTASEDGTARVWDAETGKERAKKNHPGCVNSGSFSKDGRRVLTSCYLYACVWDVETGNEIARLNGHTDTVESAFFSPDGSRIFTASQDQTLRVWDGDTGFLTLTLPGHRRFLNAGFLSAGNVLRSIGHTHNGSDFLFKPSDGCLRIITYDTRPTRETFRKVLEAPPPRAKP